MKTRTILGCTYVLLALSLVACGTGEARNAGEHDSQARPAQVRTHNNRGETEIQPDPGARAGGLRATVAFGGRESPECFGDDMTLTIREGDRTVYTHAYCSAYGFGVAQLFTDARGKHFVLLENGVGRGTRVTQMYLTIFEFDDVLDERARLLIQEPAGIGADSIYDYTVATPPGGGIVISGSWTLDREMLNATEARFAPRRSRQILEIDSGPAAQR